MQPPPVDPAEQLTVTLQAQQWNVLVHALENVDMPLRVSQPVMVALCGQMQAGAIQAAQNKAKADATDADAPVSAEQSEPHPAPRPRVVSERQPVAAGDSGGGG